MHIIFGRDVAEEVSKKHVVMELETFTYPEHGPLTAYCVLPAEKITMDLPDMDRLAGLHAAIVEAWNRKDYDTVLFGVSHVRGKFGGELDSFYDSLTDRIKETAVEQS